MYPPGADPEGVVSGGTHTRGAQWFWVYLLSQLFRGLGGTCPLGPPPPDQRLPTHITCGQLNTRRWRPPGHRQTSALTNWRADSSETKRCPCTAQPSQPSQPSHELSDAVSLPLPAYYIIARAQSRGLLLGGLGVLVHKQNTRRQRCSYWKTALYAPQCLIYG